MRNLSCRSRNLKTIEIGGKGDGELQKLPFFNKIIKIKICM